MKPKNWDTKELTSIWKTYGKNVLRVVKDKELEEQQRLIQELQDKVKDHD